MKHFATLLLLLLLSSQAQAGNPRMYKCGSFDTTNTFSTPFAVLGGCVFTTGPAGVAFITAEAEVTCTGTQSVQLWIGPGTAVIPGIIQGANFAGTVAGGVLTVPTYRPLGWYLGAAQFTGNISGNTLNVTAMSTGSASILSNGVHQVRGTGVTPAHVTAQTSGSTGGIGAYTIDGAAQNVASEIMTVDVSPAMIFGFGPKSAPGGSNPNGGNPPWLIQSGQTLTGDGMQGHPGITITGQLTSTEDGGALGGAGTYSISDPTLTTSNTANGFFSLLPIPGGAIANMPAMHESGCVTGFVTTAISNVVTGPANTSYWADIAISTDGNWSSWVNAQIYMLVY